MKIYITRHGETEWNREGRMQGWENSNLTEKGIDNARRLGESLKNIDFECIYCSPLGRAVETANCIRGNKDTKIVIKENLKEMGFGIWEGMDHLKIEELYPSQRFNFWSQPHLYNPVNGESFEELLSRVRNVWYDIISNAYGENILIVSHAVVIKAIHSIIKNILLEDFWGPPFLYDTCLTVLEKSSDEIRIILEADVSHLD